MAGSLFFGTLLAVTSCAPAKLAQSFDACRATELVVGPEATDVERAAIEDGLTTWAAPLGMPWRVVAAPSGETPAIPIRFVETRWFFGRFEDTSGAILLSRVVEDPAVLAVVTAHEVGHALGLYHVSKDARASVMNPGNRDVGPTEDDLAAITALWGRCDPSNGEPAASSTSVP